MRNLLVVVAVSWASVALAGPSEPFSYSRFNEYKRGANIFVVGLHSKSCGSCAIQKPLLEDLLKRPEFAGVAGLMADYDKERALRKELKAPSPSTLILMRGSAEVTRLVGSTQEQQILKFLRTAK